MKKNEMNSPKNMYIGTREYIIQYISPVAAIATDGYWHAKTSGIDLNDLFIVMDAVFNNSVCMADNF